MDKVVRLSEELKGLMKNDGDVVQILAQNVHDYFYAHYKEHGWDDLKNFICCRAPFEKMNIIYNAHSYYGQKRLSDIRTEVFVTEYDKVDFGDMSAAGIKSEVTEEEAASYYEEVKASKVLKFDSVLEGVPMPLVIMVAIGEDGRVRYYKDLAYVEVLKQEHIKRYSEDDMRHFRMIAHRDSTIAMAAINFMNCRNVEIVDNPPLRKWVKAAEKRGEKPPVSYKTLVLHPFGRRNRLAQKREAPIGTDTALHIVRGHFKDYRGGEGLGRYHAKGLWWWGPQIRGTSPERVVEKKYEISTETKDEEAKGGL